MRKLLVPLLALAMVLAACGGDDDGGDETTAEASGGPPVSLEGDVNDEGTAEATGDTAEIAVEADDNFFSPTFVQATPGATVTVALSNAGSRPHTFTVDDAGVDEELSGDTEASVDVTIPDSGTLVFYCRFHRGAGMQGAFFTEEGQGAGSGGETTPSTTADPGFDY